MLGRSVPRAMNPKPLHVRRPVDRLVMCTDDQGFLDVSASYRGKCPAAQVGTSAATGYSRHGEGCGKVVSQVAEDRMNSMFYYSGSWDLAGTLDPRLW